MPSPPRGTGFETSTEMRTPLFGLATTLLLAAPAALSGAPDRAGVVETIHGVQVEDPYRWLEDWGEPEVQRWSDARTAEARTYLDALPAVGEMRARLADLLLRDASETYLSVRSAGDRIFALRRDPRADQPILVTLEPGNDEEGVRVLLDPRPQRANDPSRTIDWFVPSPDGQRVAVSISEGGTERGTLHVLDVSDGRLADAPIANVYNATAGGDVAWAADGSGFFYTRYPRAGEQPEGELAFHQKLYFHRLGDPQASDRLELGREFDRTAEIRLESQVTTGRLLATVQDGDSGRFSVYLRQREGRWLQVSRFEQGVFHATFGDADDLFLLTYDGAPRGRILRLSASAPDLAEARQIVGELPDAALAHSFYSHASPTLLWSGDALCAVYEAGGPTALKMFDRTGRALEGPDLPSVSNVTGLARSSDGGIFFAAESYTRERRWYVHRLADGTRESRLNAQAGEQWSDVEVTRENAVSMDGTRVPITILRRAGAPARNARALVTAYGGFGISVHPQFTREWRALLDQDVTIVVANIRGGGEYGQAWHADAILTNRQRAFDDFAAAIRHVQREGYTSPARTGIIGASNGGLLVGVTLTQHPELIGAVIADVGLFDMIRAEQDPNGVFNIPEFGSTRDPRQFAALRAYSPYHAVARGRDYPAALFTTGANDPRVNPMHSRKMVARLQASTSGTAPILLRATRGTGHGAGTPLRVRVEELADAYGFLLSRLR